MLSYREDRRAVALGALNLSLVGLPYAVELAGPWVAVFLAVSSVLSLSSWAIIHNHIHVRTFRARWLNQVAAMLATVTVGIPVTGLVLTHIMNHHVHIGGEADWSRPANAGGGWGGLRLLRYAAVTPVRMARGRAAAGAPRLPAPLHSQRSRERWLLVALVAGALVWQPATFLCFTLPIWIAGWLIFLGINLLQHDACEPGSDTAHSRDFTGRVINFLFFNGGYHTAHHDRPGVHWSELPAEHARLARRARRDLEAPSLLGYLVREYLVPRTWRAQ